MCPAACRDPVSCSQPIKVFYEANVESPRMLWRWRTDLPSIWSHPLVMTSICLPFFCPRPQPTPPFPSPLWSRPLCMAHSALTLKDHPCGCFFAPKSPQKDFIDFCTSCLQKAPSRRLAEILGSVGAVKRASQQTFLRVYLQPEAARSQEVPYRCAEPPADLPHGLPLNGGTCLEHKICWLAPVGSGGNARHEWNLLAQDVFAPEYVNMNPLLSTKRFRIPEARGMQAEDDSPPLFALLFCDWLVPPCPSCCNEKKRKKGFTDCSVVTSYF